MGLNPRDPSVPRRRIIASWPTGFVPLRWTPETGPEVKIENRGSERRGIEDGKDTEVAHGGGQSEGGVGGREGGGDGEPVGIGARASPDPDPSVEEAVAGGGGGSVRARRRPETRAWRGGARGART